MSRVTTTYSHAAPYIRERILSVTSLKLTSRTQRDQRGYGREAHGLIAALEILLRSPEGQGSPTGYPDYHGFDKNAVLAEVERYVGGAHRMRELGFTDEETRDAEAAAMTPPEPTRTDAAGHKITGGHPPTLELSDVDGDRLEFHELPLRDGDYAPRSVHVQAFAAHGEVVLSPAQAAELRGWLRG